jgi:spermidine synthase
MEDRLAQPSYQRVAESLREVGFSSATQMLGTYAGRAVDLKPWLRDAEINRDGNLRLQYLAGLALNNSKEGEIYGSMLTYRRFPEDLFRVSEQRRATLLNAVESRGQ